MPHCFSKRNRSSHNHQVLSGATFILLFLFGDFQRPVNIASDKVSEYCHQPGKEQEITGCPIIENVGDAVPEAAHDEQGHTEEQRQIATLACELHRRTHDETARNSKNEYGHQALSSNDIHHFLCTLDILWRCIIEYQTHQPTANEVTRYDIQQVNQLRRIGEETRLAGIERQPIMHHTEETKAEHHSSRHTSNYQIHIAAQSDAHTSEHTTYQQIHNSLHFVVIDVRYFNFSAAKIHIII